MPTDYPTKGDDNKISLYNSNYPQFDYDYALDLKENYPDIWEKGGNIRGNEAFNNWTKARKGTETESVLSWIKEREAWAARHYKNFRLAGVVAQIKWGVIGSRGESYMKELINEQKAKDRSMWQRITDYIKSELGIKERRIKDVEEWDGAASNYPDTPSYCDACLINLNDGPREEWTQTNCKLPVREAGDSQDVYVRQAVYAAAAFFNRTDAPADALNSAREELLMAYREMDEEPPESLTRAISYSQIMEQVYSKFWEWEDGMGMEVEREDYPIDIYMDGDSHYLLTTYGGKLFRYPITIMEEGVTLGPKSQVMTTHSDVSTRTVIRSSNGQKRWISISATSVLNRDGEIDSRELFDSFIEYAERTKEYPVRMFYHAGESFRIGQADFLARDKNCYITSGLFDDTELAERAAKAIENNPDFWGESIGYIPTSQPELFEVSRGIKIPVYKTGINVEISQLPEKEAANLFTITKGVSRMLNSKQLEAFYQIFEGDEDAANKWLEENAATRNRQIEQQNLITRDTKEENKEVNENQENVKPEVVIDDTVINEIVNRVSGQNQETENALVEMKEEMKSANQVMSELSELVNRLKSDNEKLQATLDILKAEYDQRVAIRNSDKTTETRIVYKPRQTEQQEEEPKKSFAKIAAARLPKNAY